jgi:hypothetical protein
MPAKNHSYTVEALRSQAEMKQLRQTVNQIQHSIGQRIFDTASRYALSRFHLMPFQDLKFLIHQKCSLKKIWYF